VSLLWCVCDTGSWYTHGQEYTVCGTPFRLDDDQMDLAANARRARVWRDGARTGRHDGLASRPLRNVEPALRARARTSANLSRWRHSSSSSDLHVSGRRGVRVGRSVAAFQTRARLRARTSQPGGSRGLSGGLCPSCSSQAATSDYPETPLSPSDSAPLDFSPRSYARLPYLIRDTSLDLQTRTRRR
jgi:hypothetical protein